MPDWRRFAVAVAAATALVASAPFLGLFRSSLRRAFPEDFVLIVFGLIGAALAVALAAAVFRIRERRGVRYGLIAVALACAAAYAYGSASDNRESTAVELFHFVQYGVVTFLFYRATRRAGDLSVVLLPALAGLIVGVAEEWFQWFLPARVGEIRDLWLNLAAIGCALLFSVAVDPPDRMVWGLRPSSARLVSRFAVAAILSMAAFVDVIHLGHRIVDPEIGTFESRYTADRLGELQASRDRRWRVQPPPPVLVRLSREDQYLTEAMQHAQERNELWAAGDAAGAWRENRILEKYFAPALDLRWYGAPDGLRWPAAQRADAERQAASRTDAAYDSAAYPYPIFAWPRRTLWAVAVGAAFVVLLAGVSAARRSPL
jgi:VanZ family protein